MSSPDCRICQPLSRRRFLERAGLGLGALGLASLLGEHAAAGDSPSPLAPKKPHFPAKAKRIIHIFCEGGPSQVDTFDPKPALEKFHNKLVKDVLPEYEKNVPKTTDSGNRLTGTLQRSGFKFSKHGQSGIEVSELFPKVAQHVDDLCVVRSMYTPTSVHEPAQLMMTCGDQLFVRPSIGSWVVYGLGADNQNLPAFVALNPAGTTASGDKHWSSSFLPAWTRGTGIMTRNMDLQRMLEFIRSESTSIREQSRQLALLEEMNREHLADRKHESLLEGRIESFETAFRMQIEATDAFDISREPAHIRAMYGETEQGNQMLLARRLIERGVRVVQVWHSGWDTHDENDSGHQKLCAAADQPIAALLTDLKQRGLLDDTIVLWGGEFGRTPTSDNNDVAKKKGIGRDHNATGFTVWLAGGGFKRGLAYGATDEFGAVAREHRTSIHDLHATMLHQLGFDHEKLTYRYAGRDFRLTDVHGHVVKDILA